MANAFASAVAPKPSSARLAVPAIISVLITLLVQAQYHFDNDPNTAVDWNMVMLTLTTAYGLFAARDNKVTSEQAGAV